MIFLEVEDLLHIAERLGLAPVIAFYGINGLRLTFSNDEAYELVMAVAAGDLEDVASIAKELEAKTQQRD